MNKLQFLQYTHTRTKLIMCLLQLHLHIYSFGWSDPPKLNLIASSDNRNVGAEVEFTCRATGGNPVFTSHKYKYSLCFRPLVKTLGSDESRELSVQCPQDYFAVGNGTNFKTKLEHFHRGTLFCRVEYKLNDMEQMVAQSSPYTIDVSCMKQYYFNYSTLQYE